MADDEEEIIFSPASLVSESAITLGDYVDQDVVTNAIPATAKTSWLRTTITSSPLSSSCSSTSFREDPLKRQIIVVSSPLLEGECNEQIFSRNYLRHTNIMHARHVIEDPRESNNYYEHRGFVPSYSDEGERNEDFDDEVIVFDEPRKGQEQGIVGLCDAPPLDEILIFDQVENVSSNSENGSSDSSFCSKHRELIKEETELSYNSSSKHNELVQEEPAFFHNALQPQHCSDKITTTVTSNITESLGSSTYHNKSPSMIQPKFELCSFRRGDLESNTQQRPQNVTSAVTTNSVTKVSLVHRPTALKVVQPVAQTAVEQFYDAIHQDRSQISSSDVQEALLDANLWHRKWVHQDEDPMLFTANLLLRTSNTARTVARYDRNVIDDDDEENQGSKFQLQDEKDAVLWAGLLAADRERGARNPSPTAFEQQSSSHGDENDHSRTESPSSSWLIPRTKRCRTACYGNDRCVEDAEDSEYPTAWEQTEPKITRISMLSQPNEGFGNANSFGEPTKEHGTGMLVRPKPLRVANVLRESTTVIGRTQGTTLLARPVALRPSETFQHPSLRQGVPSEPPLRQIVHIDDDSKSMGSSYNRLRRSMSPLTVSTMEQNYDGSITTATGRSPVVGMTHMVMEPEEVNVIEEFDDNENDTEDHDLVRSSLRTWILEPRLFPVALLTARDGLLHALAVNHGDTSSEQFQSCLAVLHEHYMAECDRTVPIAIDHDLVEDGLWLTLTKPTFFGNLGDNDNGDPMYTLGRMSFDMFSPTNVVCSLQGNFNSVQPVTKEDQKGILQTSRCHIVSQNYCSIPKKFKKEIEKCNDDAPSSDDTEDMATKTAMKTYDIITPFTIEPAVAAYPDALNQDVPRPIHGIMTTYGYTLQDPDDSKRRSVWITGGKIEPNNDVDDYQQWMTFFGKHPPKHAIGQKAKLLAVKLLMGATVPESMDPQTGVMEYTFTRPLGGHGMAYVDTLYCDSTLRIVKGHRGTVFVFTRSKGVPTY